MARDGKEMEGGEGNGGEGEWNLSGSLRRLF